jgi:microcystin degradation protein MlrC
MRIFTAGLTTETNTFSPWPTGRRAFEQGGVFRSGAERPDESAPTLFLARLWHEMARRDGHAAFTSVFANAQPSGPTVRSVYEEYRDEILDDAQSKGPFDVALLHLHGAMVAAGYDDCEGDMIEGLRRVVGPRAIIGAVLDLHCHLTPKMVEQANVIIAVKKYPHTDFPERAQELYELCTRAARGEIVPTSAVFDCRMVGSYPTTTEPMRSLVDMLFVAETERGVLSVSFAHGFPWGDTPETGSRVLVVTDNNAALARDVAARIGLEIYRARNDLLPELGDIEAALDLASKALGITVLADTADNAGGGAPSDNTSLLKAMLARGTRDAVFGAIWDPVTASVCADAGIGARFAIRLGGKCGPASGAPLDLEVTVRGLSDYHHQTHFTGNQTSMGLAVWVEVGGIDIVICSIRTQIYSPDAFSGLGIDIANKRIIAVKSSTHFRAGFEPIANTIIFVRTPGTLQRDFANINYKKKRDMDFFPRVYDPLAVTSEPGPSVDPDSRN